MQTGGPIYEEKQYVKRIGKMALPSLLFLSPFVAVTVSSAPLTFLVRNLVKMSLGAIAWKYPLQRIVSQGTDA